MLLTCLAQACAAQQTSSPQNAAGDPQPAKAEATSKDQGNTKAAPKGGKSPAPAADQTATQATGDQEAPPPAAATTRGKIPPLSTTYIEAGYGDWGLSGNQQKFRQYATPPTGWFLRDFRYAPILRDPSYSAFFHLEGIGQDDYRAETRLASNYGNTRISGFLSQNRFFDPTPVGIPISSRQVNGFSLRQSLNRDFALSMQFRNDVQNKNFAVPYPSLDQTTQYWDAVLGGKLGPGTVRVDYANLHYSDHTGTLVDTTTQTVGVRYLWEPSPTVGIEASTAHAGITQPNAPQNHVDTLALTSDVSLGSATDVELLLQRRQIGMPVVQDAYVRAEGLGALSLMQRWRGWRAQVGFRLQNDERVNGDHTYVDVPKWTTIEGRVSGRLSRDVRLTVRGYTQSLTDQPNQITDDPRSLYFNGRDFVQAKLEAGTPDLSGYLVYTYRNNSNTLRSVSVSTYQYTLGGTWQINPVLNLFAEYHHEVWTGTTDVTDFPALGLFLPDSTTGIAELTWNLHSRATLSISYTGFSVANSDPLMLQDAATHAGFLTINGHYRFPAGYDLGLTVAPWTYRDSVVGAMNYDATVLMVTGSMRF
jgi:hypothetical protein